MSHHGDTGIQQHSIGDFYPGGISIHTSGEGGECVAWNLVTGEEYGRVQFDNWGDSYYSAHAEAEALIPANVPYRTRRQHVAGTETGTDASNVRRNAMVSQVNVPVQERVLSDEFFNKVNPRQVLSDLVSYYDGIIAKNQEEWVEFQQTECASHPECVERAKTLIQLNVAIRDGLAAVLADGDERTKAIRALEQSADPFQHDPFQQLFAQLGIDPSSIDFVDARS